VTADPVSGIDVFPTLCDLLDLPKPAGMHGQSLTGRWEGKERDPERTIFAAQGAPGKNRAAMLRTPRYKFTRYDDGGTELYDLAQDPNELDNRVDRAEYADTARRMKNQLDDWEQKYSRQG
jgi:arylsulfatase A-like enzyme